MTLIGLYSGFYEAKATFLYGADQPVELWVFPEAFQRAFQRRPYQRVGLDLPDIVESAGYKLANAPTRVWPNRMLPPAPHRQQEGYRFEWQVASRVHKWLTQQGGYGIVQAAWLNTVVTRSLSNDVATSESSPDVPQPRQTKKKKTKKAQLESLAEWDVVLVLKNGILIHLECKTGGDSRKELSARMSMLQRATSQLARMVLCRPYNFSVPDALASYRARLRNCQRIGIPHFAVFDGSAPPNVPTFEESLERLLAPYRPPGG